jgi:hypothetical protein
LRPLNILIANLIEMSEQMDTGEPIDYLNHNLAAAVITKEENDRLTNAGLGAAPLDQDHPDPWARYRTAGLDPETFKPLK